MVKAMLIQKIGKEAGTFFLFCQVLLIFFRFEAAEFDMKYPDYNPVGLPKEVEMIRFDAEKLKLLESKSNQNY